MKDEDSQAHTRERILLYRSWNWQMSHCEISPNVDAFWVLYPEEWAVGEICTVLLRSHLAGLDSDPVQHDLAIDIYVPADNLLYGS